MKKVLSSLFMLILLLLLFWGAAGWFFGANAYNELSDYLHRSEQIPGEKLFRAELLSFKKTPLGAKARLKIHSDTVFLNEALGDIDINVRMLNGPFFIRTVSLPEKALSTGTTRWKLTIDQDSLEQSQADILATLFPDSLPTATIIIDFDNKAHYQIVLQSYLGKAHIQGVYDLNTAGNKGIATFQDVKLKLSNFEFNIPRATISYQHEANITAAFKPGTTHFAIPELSVNDVKHNRYTRLKLNGDMALQTKNNNKRDFLNVLLKSQFEQLYAENGNKSTQLPIDKADLRLQIENLSIDGLISVSESRAELDNLRQQIQWTLEENAELPEGQDRIWQLNDQLSSKQAQLPSMISQLLFSNTARDDAKQSGITLKITAQKSGKPSSLSMVLAPDSQLSGSSQIKTLMWLQLFQGSGVVKLSDDLFAYLKQYPVTLQNQPLSNKHFKMNLKGGKIQLH